MARRGSSSTRGVGKRLNRNYNRLNNGQFTFGNNSGAKPRKIKKGAIGFSKDIQARNEARREVLDGLSREKRNRLVNLYGFKDRAQPKPEATPQAALAVAKDKAKKRRLPRPRPIVEPDSLGVDDKGNFVPWLGNAEARKYKKGFKVSTDNNFEYKITHKGENLVLNRNQNIVRYDGEVVRGMPKLSPRIASDSNEKVVNDLAKFMSLTEGSDKHEVAPVVPVWKPSLNGSIKDKSLVRSRKGAGDYGEMQIHHVGQWFKASPDKIVEDVKAGRITLEEGKRQTRDLVTPIQIQTKKGIKEDYEINIQPKGVREFVVLPGGLHDVNSPLYGANHPKGIDLDADKLKVRAYGIPKKGEGGREEFNQFRNGFWTEMYRRESFILSGELNRRIKSGKLTPDEAKELWTKAVNKLDKQQKDLIELRRQRDEEAKAGQPT